MNNLIISISKLYLALDYEKGGSRFTTLLTEKTDHHFPSHRLFLPEFVYIYIYISDGTS